MLKHLLKRFFSDSISSDLNRESLPKRSAPAIDMVHNYLFPFFWGVSDPARFRVLVEELISLIPEGSYVSDNLMTFGRNNSALDDEAFMAAWQQNVENDSDRAILWRRYILATSAFHCLQLPGDFVECGAYTGVGVKTVVDYLGGVRFPKQFWAYDIFRHDESMPNVPMPQTLTSDLFERVKRKFVNYPQVRLVKGLIPGSFEGNSPQKIAYLHIDLNQPDAEIAALDVLFDLVVPGGMVILDDYEWASIYRSQKLAEDAWFDQRGYRVMPLPTGQGIVIKQ